jgi:hypothetical protein
MQMQLFAALGFDERRCGIKDEALLVGALIACCVVRSRRNNKGQRDADRNAQALQSRPPSNYGRIDGKSGSASTYVDVVVGPPAYGDLVVGPPANYDAWSDANNYNDVGQ